MGEAIAGGYLGPNKESGPLSALRLMGRGQISGLKQPEECVSLALRGSGPERACERWAGSSVLLLQSFRLALRNLTPRARWRGLVRLGDKETRILVAWHMGAEGSPWESASWATIPTPSPPPGVGVSGAWSRVLRCGFCTVVYV